MAALGLCHRGVAPRPAFLSPFLLRKGLQPETPAHRELLSGAIGHPGSQAFLLRRDCTQEARYGKPRPPTLLNALGKGNIGSLPV